MRLIRHFLVLSLLVLSLGCAGNSPSTHFYLLEPPTPNVLEQPLPGGLVIGVAPVQISGTCADDRLVFREEPFEIKYYHYHRWASPLAGRVSQLLFEQLQTANPGVDIQSPPFAKRPDILLNVRLTACEEIDGPTGWNGRVSFFAAARRTDGAMLFGKTFSCDTPCEEQHPRAVVAALSQSFATCTTDLIQELQQQLAD